MGTWRTYDSTEPGAPQNSSTAGSMVAVLDAVLVGDGGGEAWPGKPAAGWTHAFTPVGHTRVYRPSVASIARMFFRVHDDAATEGLGVQAGREAGCRGYTSMTDIDTGVNPFPTVAQQNYGVSLLKSFTAGATQRRWFVAADDRTCIYICYGFEGFETSYGPHISYPQVHYFGDIDPLNATDGMQSVCIGGGPVQTTPLGGTTNLFVANIDVTNPTVGASAGCYIAGDHLGVPGSISPALRVAASNFCSPKQTGSRATTNGAAFLSERNEPNASVYISPILVAHGTVVRGKLRGIYHGLHRRRWFIPDSTISHYDATYRVLWSPRRYISTDIYNPLLVETTNTVT